MNRPSKPLAALLAALFLVHGLPVMVVAQPPPDSAPAPQAPTFKPEELDALVAPIALYPDPLLAQVLMASTYPLEVVEAARWQKQNSKLKDKALEDALQQQTWDPSVKSLTAFPPVLTMLNDQLDWTQKLGDAFLAQQDDLMQAVQRLRVKAQAAGNLTSNTQQTVTVQQPPANVIVQGQPAPPPTIIIEPAQPQVVYVPTYNPTVVYGAWPPTYPPPYSYYPPGYVATSVISFGVGMAVGAALWGGCSWGGGYGGHNDVNVNVNNYNNFNRTNISNNNWQHNVDHRKGVQYRDNATKQKYNRGTSSGVQSREAYRGRAEQGRQELARGAASDYKTKPAGGRDGGAGAGQGARQPGATRDKSSVGAGQGTRQPGANRDTGTAGTKGGGRQPGAERAPATAQRPSTQAQRPSTQERTPSKGGASAFQGMGSGQQARADASRGQASRQSAAAARGGGGGGNRGGGGGGGGGGHRGGGGGGGRRR